MKCPFCDSDRGYYMLERVHRALLFNFDGEPIGGTEDIKFFLYHENEQKKKADRSKKFLLGGVMSLVVVCLLRTYS